MDLIRKGYEQKFNRKMKDDDYVALLRLAGNAGVDITPDSTYQEIHAGIVSYMNFVSAQLENCNSDREAQKLLHLAYGKLRDYHA